MPMFHAAHPGAILRQWMANDITVTQLALHLGVTRVTLSRILNGSAGVTATMAIKLAEAFPKTSPELWMALQTNYELSRALRLRRKRIAPVRQEQQIAA